MGFGSFAGFQYLGEYVRLGGPYYRTLWFPLKGDSIIELGNPTGVLIVNPKLLETGLRTNSAGIPYTLLLRIEAIGFPTFGLLL